MKAQAVIPEFLQGRRIAVVGVSRTGDSAANAVFRKLRDSGHEVFPVNPNAAEVEGARCFPSLASIPGELDGVILGTHPDVFLSVVRQAAEKKVRLVWFHRSFGQGSVSAPATSDGTRFGMRCIVGGCPMMYCEPIELPHRGMRWWHGHRGRIQELRAAS